MRAKLLILLISILGLFSAALIFRVDQLLFADKVSVNEVQSRAQMGALSETLAAEIKSVRETLELSWPQVHALGKDYSKGKPYSRFAMMGTLVKSSAGEWSFASFAFLENTTVRNWAANYTTLALKSLKDSDVAVGESAVLAVLDPDRKPFFLVVTHTDSQWLATLTGTGLFQSAMDRQKGLLSSFYIVNNHAQTLGHTTPEYVGSLIADDPIVADMIKNESTSGAGIFQTPAGPVQGFYEQVKGTNVAVVVSTPMSEIMDGRKEVRWQLILMGLGLALFGGAVIMGAFPKSPPPEKAASPGPASDPVETPSEHGVRMQAYSKAAASLAHELRGPLLSLLGRARLLREKTPDQGMQKDLLQIEEGARDAHGTLHKLLTFSGEKDEPIVATSLKEVVMRTLRMMEQRLSACAIEIETDLQDTPLIQGQPSLLMKAFEQIIDNAIEAMDKSLGKKLRIKLVEGPTGPQLSFNDSGEGIDAKYLPQIFDPFFTTRTASHHSGLGLSLAHGIITACSGRLHVKSARGGGTEVEIIFDVNETAKPSSTGESPAVAVAPTTVALSPASKVPSAPLQLPAEIFLPSLSNQSTVAEPAPVLQVREAPQPPPFRRHQDKPLPLVEPRGEVPTLEGDDLTEYSAEHPEVLNDGLMERTLNMIDHLDELTEPSEKSNLKLNLNSKLKSAPQDVLVSPQVAPPPPPTRGETALSSKIDKPKLASKAKASRLLETPTAVRRPRDRS